jgi:hypothetical protein
MSALFSERSLIEEWHLPCEGKCMTSNTFYILINLRTQDGFESFGKYNVGNNRKSATALFRQLKGSHDIDPKTMLTMELEETVNGLPINLQMIACTLEELAYNTKIIVKETFKYLNLKGTR